MKKFYITTPIFYINDKPHIGHAYTAFAADTIANYFRFQEVDVFLLTGTDENSQKTLDRAIKDNKTPEQFSDEMALKWKDTWKILKINYNRFIRTSEKQHYVAVQDIIAKINENGDVYKGVYEGLYCTGCEEFKTEKDLVNGDCILHEKKCESIKENNYFFKLSNYTKPITEHIKNNPNFIRPSSSRSEILSMLNSDIKDISISREGNKWGIPIPFDKSQVVYVWFDALINYLTGISYPSEDHLNYWPADLHLVGKDIVRFHCIIWPAMLMSAGIELPKSIFAHGFFTNEGRKISKSLGNSINPLEVVEKYGVDALRYYLLSNVIFGGDGDFSFNSLVSQYNSDLSDNFGNAIQRIYILAQKNKIDFDINVSSFSAILKRHPEYKNFMDNFQFMEALSYVRDLNSKINKDIQVEAPWTIADNKKLIFVLQDKARRLYESSWLLKPFLSDKVDKAQTILENRLKGEDSILFPKIK